jgi:pentatricopeptide repeat protein
MEALEEMRAVGLAPNEFSYSSAIASCASATTSIGCSAAVDLGRMLLAAMLRDGLEVTAVPYNTLLAGCARAVERDSGAMDLCWQLFSEMQERSIAMTVVTYTTLIDAGARAGDERILEHGMQLLQQMVDQGLAPNVFTFNAMFKAHVLKSMLYRDVK